MIPYTNSGFSLFFMWGPVVLKKNYDAKSSKWIFMLRSKIQIFQLYQAKFEVDWFASYLFSKKMGSSWSSNTKFGKFRNYCDTRHLAINQIFFFNVDSPKKKQYAKIHENPFVWLPFGQLPCSNELNILEYFFFRRNGTVFLPTLQDIQMFSNKVHSNCIRFKV